jgi:hypothetical protein
MTLKERNDAAYPIEGTDPRDAAETIYEEVLNLGLNFIPLTYSTSGETFAHS